MSLLGNGLEDGVLGYLRAQLTLASFLRLECVHRFDMRRQARQAALEGVSLEQYTRRAALPGLPHVDTAMSKGGGGAMGGGGPLVRLFTGFHFVLNAALYPFGLCTLRSAAFRQREMSKMLRMEMMMRAPGPVLKVGRCVVLVVVEASFGGTWRLNLPRPSSVTSLPPSAPLPSAPLPSPPSPHTSALSSLAAVIPTPLRSRCLE